MSESIFIVLANRKTTTSVPALGKDEKGKTIKEIQSLPNHLFPNDKVFEDKEALIAWATENDTLFPLLQMGLQSGLIDARAKFKFVGKNDVWTSEYGQNNVNNMKWKPVKRPEASLSAETKAINALSGMTPEQIATIMEQVNK